MITLATSPKETEFSANFLWSRFTFLRLKKDLENFHSNLLIYRYQEFSLMMPNFSRINLFDQMPIFVNQPSFSEDICSAMFELETRFRNRLESCLFGQLGIHHEVMNVLLGSR